MQATSTTVPSSGASGSEEWRPIPGYETYEASSLGRIRRAVAGKGTRVGKLRVPCALPNGYLTVDLWIGGQRFKLYVHRAVASAFHGPPPTPDHEVAHKNGDVADNRPSNIRWATHAENEADKVRHGTLPRGSRHANSKITEADIVAMRARRAAGETLAAIADDFGLCFQNVDLICRGKTWAHVPL